MIACLQSNQVPRLTHTANGNDKIMGFTWTHQSKCWKLLLPLVKTRPVRNTLTNSLDVCQHSNTVLSVFWLFLWRQNNHVCLVKSERVICWKFYASFCLGPPVQNKIQFCFLRMARNRCSTDKRKIRESDVQLYNPHHRKVEVQSGFWFASHVYGNVLDESSSCPRYEGYLGSRSRRALGDL